MVKIEQKDNNMLFCKSIGHRKITFILVSLCLCFSIVNGEIEETGKYSLFFTNLFLEKILLIKLSSFPEDFALY